MNTYEIERKLENLEYQINKLVGSIHTTESLLQVLDDKVRTLTYDLQVRNYKIDG